MRVAALSEKNVGKGRIAKNKVSIAESLGLLHIFTCPPFIGRTTKYCNSKLLKRGFGIVATCPSL